MLVGMVVGRSDLAARTTAVALVWAGAVLAVLGYTLGAIIAQVFGFDSSGGPPLRAADGVRMTLEGDYLERLAASGWPHGIPVAAWLRGELRAHVEELILDPKIMEPLHLPTIRASWQRLLQADGAAADAEAGRIWALLMYGQWRVLMGKA